MSKSAGQALSEFLGVAVNYIGKEIELKSSQHFSITYNIEDENMPMYQFQYGFPQSGCVSLSMINGGEHEGKCARVLVTAPSADKEFVTATFKDKKEVGAGLSVGVSFGIDMGFDEHKTFAEIEANPNAITMVDLAVQDLSQAVVLGESREAVSEGEKHLPAGRAR